MDMSERVGIDFAPLTLQRYEVADRHVKTYLERQNKKDIELVELNHEFITGFEHYLKVVAGCQHNSAMKHIKALKKVVGIALSRDLIRIDPFKSYKITTMKVDRGYLNEWELEMITDLKLRMPRTELVRDLFLVQCYTGLAYKDLYELAPENIQVGVDGEKWIFIKRRKTDTPCHIPILPPVEPILIKYADHPTAKQRGKLLPVFSNQKMNSYLKEIADLAGIHKQLTTHMARHTFATTIALSNGLPIETTSKILGHTKIPTTQIYGRILDHKIAEDMNALKKRLERKD
jgi:site-specific recombinase XerD